MPWSRLTLLRAHRVEAGLLLIIEQIVEPGERRTHALRRIEHPNRCQRRVRWAGVPQVLGRFRGGVPEFVQGLALPLIGAVFLCDPAHRLLTKHAGSLTSADESLALRLRPSAALGRPARLLPHFIETALLLVVQ